MDTTNLTPYTQAEIVAATQQAWKEVGRFVQGLSHEAFHHRPTPKKWSAAENLDHLCMSTKPLIKGLGVPKLMLKSFGKPNRPTRTYQEVVLRYKERLGALEIIPNQDYIPDFKETVTTEEMLTTWASLGKKYVDRMTKWSDEAFDKFLLPHPLMGKVTVREMLFFTIYHTHHHLALMKERATMG